MSYTEDLEKRLDAQEERIQKILSGVCVLTKIAGFYHV